MVHGNGAITLLIHLLPQHGIIHGNCAKIWEQILPWLNQRIKTSFLPTCWGILAGAGMGGLGCIGKLITNFIASMTAQRREIIRIGAMAIQVTVEAMKIVCIMQNVTLIMENGMTLLAQGPTPLLSARGQFRRKQLQIHMQLCICSEFPFPYSASCCPSSRTFSPFNLFW